MDLLKGSNRKVQLIFTVDRMSNSFFNWKGGGQKLTGKQRWNEGEKQRDRVVHHQFEGERKILCSAEMLCHLQQLVRSNHFFLSLEANVWQAHKTTWSLGVKATLSSFFPVSDSFLWLSDWQQWTSGNHCPLYTAVCLREFIPVGLALTFISLL